MRKILVLRGGALGDFIVTLPALAALRERWPAARIELAGNATAAQLARTRGLLDAVHAQHEARWSALFAAGALPGDFAAWLATFDLVVCYWPDPDGELARRFPLRLGQTFVSAAALPRLAPAAAHYCEPLRALNIECSDFFFRLAERPLGHPVSCIALHPGSGSSKKNWRVENWLALLARLPQPAIIFLGAAEIERWSALTRRRPSKPLCASGASTRLIRGVSEQRVGGNTLRLAVALPLEELVAHLASCRLFLGHDSGISHLAAACGVPCILLFGPTDPAMWAPPAPHVRVIKRGEKMEAITVEDVESEVAARINARIRSTAP